MDARAAAVALGAGTVLALGGGALLRPTAPRAAPRPATPIATLAWVAPDDDPGGGWAARPLREGCGRIVAVARDVLTGRRVDAVCRLRPADGGIGTTQGGGIGPWAWDSPAGLPLVLEAAGPAHRRAAGPVSSPAPGTARGLTLWLVPLGAALVGRVEEADGRPAAGAEVALALPRDGEGSLALAARRLRGAAIPVPEWESHLRTLFRAETTAGPGGGFTLEAAPGQAVRVVARHRGRSAVLECVVPRDATPLPPLRLTDPDRPAPEPPAVPEASEAPPDGIIALAVRGPDGGAPATEVTLQDGGRVVARAHGRGEWLELPAPAGRPLLLAVGAQRRPLTLVPGERLWLGEWRLVSATAGMAR